MEKWKDEGIFQYFNFQSFNTCSCLYNISISVYEAEIKKRESENIFLEVKKKNTHFTLYSEHFLLTFDNP